MPRQPQPGRHIPLRRAPIQRFEHRRIDRSLPDPPPRSAIIYTDGAASGVPVKDPKNRRRTAWATAWGFISTAGGYGFGSYPQLVRYATGDQAVVAELRAVHEATDSLPDSARIIVRLDSTYAIDMIAAWARGSRDLPPGYIGSHLRVPTLEVLRRRVARLPGRITAEHVQGHAGDALNEAAHSLAQLAMRWGRGIIAAPGASRESLDITRRGLRDFTASSQPGTTPFYQ